MVNEAEIDKLDGYLETIRGPTPVSTETELFVEDLLDVEIGGIRMIFRGDDATAIK